MYYSNCVIFPFLYVFQLYYQVLNFGMIVSSALMIWKGLMVVTGSESPIVVVLRYKGQGYKGRGVMVMTDSESPIVVVLRYTGQGYKWGGGNC